MTYRSKKNAYEEQSEQSELDSEESLRFFILAERCKKEGALQANNNNPDTVGLTEALCQSDDCPPVFYRDGIQTIYVEYRTVSSVE